MVRLNPFGKRLFSSDLARVGTLRETWEMAMICDTSGCSSRLVGKDAVGVMGVMGETGVIGQIVDTVEMGDMGETGDTGVALELRFLEDASLGVALQLG